MRYRDEDAQSVSSRSSRSSRGPSQQPTYVDRFRPDAAFSQPSASAAPQGPASIPQILSLIKRAVRPTLQQPDLALNLQIADMINEKQGSAPREAAMAIVGYVNQTSATSILAMSVLDVCVKNCGYPFHLQISRKDFLNNLVKRFPEKPPLRYTHTQTLVLEAIQEWRETICRTSKHKADFGFIRDMHRLLQYKGYIFPAINREDAAVLNAVEELKSAAELEREDRDAQSAKLHELLRTGTPQDLEEANKIMKVLAGFKEQQTDYRAQVARKLDEARQKGEILEEMLNGLTDGDHVDANDVFGELASELQSVLPQIRKIRAAEQEEDPEAADKCAALHSYLEQLVAKYRLVVEGDVAGARNLHVDSLSSGSYAGQGKKSLIDSLIDFGDEPSPSPAPAGASSGASGSDLLGLDFGGLSLGGASASASGGASANAPNDLFDLGTPSTPSAVAPSASTSSDFDIFGGPAAAPAAAPAAPASPAVSPLTGPIKLSFSVARATDTVVTAHISSNGSKTVSNVRLEIAGTRGRPITMGTASGTTLHSATEAITQPCTFPGTQPVKFRWRLVAKSGLDEVEESGTLADL